MSPLVSGNHAKFVHEVDASTGEHLVFIQDTSTNGTYVDGKKLGKGNRLCLDHNHEIAFVQPRKGIEKVAFLYKAAASEEQNEHPDIISKYYIGRSLGAYVLCVCVCVCVCVCRNM
jgi:serine/threonine-protein kinase CHEK2